MSYCSLPVGDLERNLGEQQHGYEPSPLLVGVATALHRLGVICVGLPGLRHRHDLQSFSSSHIQGELMMTSCRDLKPQRDFVGDLHLPTLSPDAYTT